ncbi:MAG: putative toxin-antitoxin system toxin component, PIN family [Crocosphaera sp.]|nr:putative toxin-antitoxin system toxin component, PIN family [Crocosphaera sp.]
MTIKRYVIDTNVLISAVLLPDSTAYHPYIKALDTGILLASSSTLAEYSEVILRSKFDRYSSQERRQVFLNELIKDVEQIMIIEEIDACRDPKDNKFLEVAVNGMADILITGDNDLLNLNPFRGIIIITPADFIGV